MNLDEIDLLDPENHADNPIGLYNWLRENDPVHWDPLNELWWISRYDDLITVSRDPSLFTSTEGNRPHIPADASMIHQDGHAHLMQRGIVADRFSPRAVAALEPFTRAQVNLLIDAMMAKGEAEFIGDLAAQLPMRVIGQMLGTPPENQDMVLAWVDVFGMGGCGPRWVTDEVEAAFMSFAGYHEEIIERKRLVPGDDLLTTWLNARLDGEPMRDDQLLYDHVLLTFGGSETTRNVIGGAVDLFSRHEDQRAWLRQHPEGMANAVEEIIRWVTPFVSMCRTATRDVELGGKTIAAGQQIVMLYPAANRDPRRFTDPDAFDIRREFKHRPVTFGYGAHFCLGAALARMELRVVIEELFRRIPDIRVKPGTTPEWSRSSFIRGIKHMPVVFTPPSP